MPRGNLSAATSNVGTPSNTARALLFLLVEAVARRPLDKKIEKYDKTLNKMSAEECKQWGQEVLTELKARGHDLEKDKFTFLAGDKYCKYILKENSIKNAHQVYKENELRGIGHILRFLAQTNDNNSL